MCVCARVCPTLCNAMDCSPPGSSVHGIFRARILKWVSKEPAWPRDQTHLFCFSCIGRRILFHWYTLYERVGCIIPAPELALLSTKRELPQPERVFLAGKGRAAWMTSFPQPSRHYTKVALQFHPTQRLRCVDDSKQGRKVGDTSISPRARERLRFLVTWVTFAIDFFKGQ